MSYLGENMTREPYEEKFKTDDNNVIYKRWDHRDDQVVYFERHTSSEAGIIREKTLALWASRESEELTWIPRYDDLSQLEPTP